MARIMPVSEVKMRMTELVTRLEEGEEEIVVTRRGRAAAVLMSADMYESLQETLFILSQPKLLRKIQRARAYFRRGGKGKSMEEVFGEDS